jgi:hypothetical protein
MPTELLEVNGTIDCSQFWPLGQSDSNTVKLRDGTYSFRFEPSARKPPRVTYAVEGAQVHGKVTKNALTVSSRSTFSFSSKSILLGPIVKLHHQLTPSASLPNEAGSPLRGDENGVENN